MKKQMIIALAAVAAMASGTAMAYEGGDWRTTIGMTNVDPEQRNGQAEAFGTTFDISVDDATQLSFTGAYFFTDALALELLASLPFEHDIALIDTGVPAVGQAGATTKHLPPTLTLQYHFNSGGKVIPYVGLGYNYTYFFSTKGYGALNGADVEIDASSGGTVQLGLDYMLSDNMFLNVDYRYISIESDVKVGGAKVGVAKINPTLVGVSLGYKF
jgi:outer membrane protein